MTKLLVHSLAKLDTVTKISTEYHNWNAQIDTMKKHCLIDFHTCKNVKNMQIVTVQSKKRMDDISADAHKHMNWTELANQTKKQPKFHKLAHNMCIFCIFMTKRHLIDSLIQKHGSTRAN